MLVTDPRGALALTHEHGRRLQAEAAAERLRPASCPRRAVAAALRRAADRLDRTGPQAVPALRGSR